MNSKNEKMTHRTSRRSFGIAAATALLLAGAGAARAHDTAAVAASQGDIQVVQPWTRAAGQGATGAGYMVIRNAGAEPDRLVEGRAAVARSVELHAHIRDGDVMRMRPVEAIELPPGGEVKLEPGGFHLMLIGLAEPLRRGSHVPVTLVFERAGTVEVQLSVESAGARGPGGAGGHGHGHH